MDVSEILNNTAARKSNKTAIIYADREISYGELDTMVDRLCCCLSRMNVKKGEVVALMLHNSWEFIVSYFSLARLGAIAVPIDDRLKGDELTFILKDSGARFLIVHQLPYENSKQIFEEIIPRSQIIVVGEKGLQGNFETIVNDRTLTYNKKTTVSDADEALYFYTSGTTGRPKGVVITFGNLDSFQEGLASYTFEDDMVGYILPMSHISGAIIANEVITKGSTLCIFDNLRPDKIIQAIERHRVSWFHSVPPIFEAMLRAPHLEKYNLKSLRWIAMMGTSVPVTLMEKFQKQFPDIVVFQGYGLTETTGPFTLVPLDKADEKRSSVGIPIPRAQVKVVDSHGREVANGETGEIIVKGPMVMKCYHNDPHATAQKMRDGWLYTGDIGRFDEDGFLYHLGRKDDMIIIGGLNVFPAEIENVLLQHPLIAEAAAIGITDESRGQLIKAFVVINNKQEITKKELVSFCRDRLASYKVPKSIEFRESLPKTSSGKIAKRLLMD